jgi:DNA-binding response OmpR family regulator
MAHVDTPPFILVVDDNPEVVKVLCFYLVGAGFCVETAATADEALQQLQVCHPDLIILDIALENEPDAGFDICTIIRAGGADGALHKLADVPIIMLTARAETQDRHQGMAVGASEYITKPIQRDELIHRIRKVLQQSR